MNDNQKAPTPTATTEVNQKLSEEYRGKKYRRPRDNRVIVVSHVLQTDHPSGSYFEAIFDVIDPEPGTTGQGECALDVLQSLKEVD